MVTGGVFFLLSFIVAGSLCCLSSISRIAFLRKDLSWLLVCYLIIQNDENQAVTVFYYSGANKKKKKFRNGKKKSKKNWWGQ